MENFVFNVEQQFNNYKIKDFLKAIGISEEIIKKVKVGYVYLNEGLVSNVNNLVKSGDNVKIILPKDCKNQYVKEVKGELEILYEDQYLIAINKPVMMQTHCSKANKGVSLDQLVCGYFAPKPFVFRAVNRLDKNTSGIVLVAKDMITASFLSQQIKQGQVNKTYQAVVLGVPNKKHFFIEKPIKREREGSMKRVCSEDGKYALTECSLLEEYNGKSLLEIKLHTGRTHQIRVHLSSIGLPLFADGLYGQEVYGQTYYLHASTMTLIHPFTKEVLTINCPSGYNIKNM